MVPRIGRQGEMIRVLYIAFHGFALVVYVGCSNAPSMADVRGNVTLNGEALSDGTIRFIPQDGQSATVGGSIKSGKFETRAPLNKYRVEISSTQMPSEAKVIDRHSQANYAIVERIPQEYNTQSTLILDVQPGLNEPLFELTTR